MRWRHLWPSLCEVTSRYGMHDQRGLPQILDLWLVSQSDPSAALTTMAAECRGAKTWNWNCPRAEKGQVLEFDGPSRRETHAIPNPVPSGLSSHQRPRRM